MNCLGSQNISEDPGRISEEADEKGNMRIKKKSEEEKGR